MKVSNAHWMNEEWNSVREQFTQYRFMQQLQVDNSRHCTDCLDYYKLLAVCQALALYTSLFAMKGSSRNTKQKKV